MARYIKVEQLQKHLNIDFLEDGDFDYLESLLKASEGRVEIEIRQEFAKFVVDGELHPTLMHVILLLAATLYANREAVAYSNPASVPFNYGYMVQPFIKY